LLLARADAVIEKTRPMTALAHCDLASRIHVRNAAGSGYFQPTSS
jgi:hypothetical protein